MTKSCTVTTVASLLAGACALLASSGPAEMKPADLVEKVAAAREPFKSFVVEMRDSFYQGQGGTMATAPSEIREITWRSAGERSFTHVRTLRPVTLPSATQPTLQLHRDEYASEAPGVVKALALPPEVSTPRGYVRRRSGGSRLIPAWLTSCGNRWGKASCARSRKPLLRPSPSPAGNTFLRPWSLPSRALGGGSPWTRREDGSR